MRSSSLFRSDAGDFPCPISDVGRMRSAARSKGVKVVTYIECSAILHKNLMNVFVEAIVIALGGCETTPIHEIAILPIYDDGKTPIHRAVEEGHTDKVELLLVQGANINEKDNDGHTAIHRAAEKGHTDILKLLLDHGAKIIKKDNCGKTPIHLVSESLFLSLVFWF